VVTGVVSGREGGSVGSTAVASVGVPSGGGAGPDDDVVCDDARRSGRSPPVSAPPVPVPLLMLVSIGPAPFVAVCPAAPCAPPSRWHHAQWRDAYDT
jgi:hypothetical protein